ncbi:hypothetical protein ACFVJ4_43005 [Streptomyces sp. NPDC127178]
MGEARAGSLLDIDVVHIARTWQSVRSSRLPREAFVSAVLKDGAAGPVM